MKKMKTVFIASCLFTSAMYAQVNCPSGLMGTSSPNVGIGTTTTTSLFGVHILGGIGQSIPEGLYIERADTPITNQNNALRIDFTSNAYSAVSLAGGTCNFMLYPGSSTVGPDMTFSTNSTKPQLIIKNSGKVGIGTHTPQDKLEIHSGKTDRSGLRFSKLTALSSTTTPASDFDCNKVLTVDNTGEVILIDLTTCMSSSRIGNTDEQITELQEQITALQAQVHTLENLLSTMGEFTSKKTTIAAASLEVFPNPAAEKISVSFSPVDKNATHKIVLTNMMGELLLELNATNMNEIQELSVSELSAGNYNLTVFSNGVPVKSKLVNVVK